LNYRRKMRSKWPTRANRKPIPGPQQLSSSQSSSMQGASGGGGGAAQRLASTSAALRERARLPAAGASARSMGGARWMPGYS